MRNGTRGFSLAELSVVVAIVGLLGIITVPSFRQTAAVWRLQSAERELTAAFRLTRAFAMSTQFEYVFRLYRDRTYDIVQIYREDGIVMEIIEPGKQRVPLPEVTITTNAPNATGDVLQEFSFYGMGRTSGGSITLTGDYTRPGYVTAESQVVLYASGLVRVVGS